MPRYLVERLFAGLSDDELEAAAVRSKDVIGERFPDITWEHSHVVVDGAGEIRTYCIYEAPTEQRIHEHADLVGQHMIGQIFEIAGDIEPAQLPSR